MDTVTLISHTDGTKSIRYWIDYVVDTLGIEYYSYKQVDSQVVTQIKTATSEKVQAMLSKLF